MLMPLLGCRRGTGLFLAARPRVLACAVGLLLLFLSTFLSVDPRAGEPEGDLELGLVDIPGSTFVMGDAAGEVGEAQRTVADSHAYR